MIRLPEETIPYGILFVTVGTNSDIMMVIGLTIEVGARVRYVLHPAQKGAGFSTLYND
jgi:hypothetical protein